MDEWLHTGSLNESLRAVLCQPGLDRRSRSTFPVRVVHISRFSPAPSLQTGLAQPGSNDFVAQFTGRPRLLYTCEIL